MLLDKKFRSVLCLNGELPDKTFFANQLPVIAVDGAVNQLAKMGIKPVLIIGDLDSAEEQHLATHPHIHMPDQSSSDFAKSLAHLQANDLMPTIVVGINGGFLDHVLHNINLFTTTDALLYAPPIIGFMLKAEQSKNLSLPQHTKISLIGLPSATVTTTGLKWNLQQSALHFPGQNSCFNRTTVDAVNITVHTGSLLVMYYEHPITDAGA